MSVDLVSKNRLGGESCPSDLEILILNCSDLLGEMGIEINCEVSWAPWEDKSYLTEDDLKNPDIMANVKAIDEMFEYTKFVAQADGGEYIGYWKGVECNNISSAPLVYYDTEGQFELCGSRFVEAVFFLVDDEDLLAEFKQKCIGLGIKMDFNNLDEISIPELSCTPDELHNKKYDEYLADV